MTTHAQDAATERDDAGLARFLANAASGERDTPPDVEPGSDADYDRSDEDDDSHDESEPGSDAAERGPGEGIETDDGEQMDDNIDDLGRRPDGTEQDQPGL